MNLFRAVVRAYDSNNYTAAIEPVEGMSTQLEAVPVLYPSAMSSDMTDGSLVLVADLGDGHHVIIGKITSGTPAIAAHFADPDAHHAQSHQHEGSDILSAVPIADTVDGYHAYGTPTALSLLALDSNARFPSHRVTSSLGMTGDFIIATIEGSRDGVISRVGYKTTWVSGTAYDAVTFTCEGGGPSSSYRASITGLLFVTAQGRDTGYNQATSGAMFLITVYKNSNQAMGTIIQQIGTTNQHVTSEGNLISIAVTQKAGASATSVTVQATFTQTDCRNVATIAAWTFVGVQYSNYAASYITVTANQS